LTGVVKDPRLLFIKLRVTNMATKIQKEYEKDFYAWIRHNVALIRAGKLSEIDSEHVAEELESMGKSDKRELISRFAILLGHLLKWKFQPKRRGNSWKYTIETQRFDVSELLSDSPSLNYELEKQLQHAYEKALLIASNETGLAQTTFPKICPFSLKESLNAEFFPD
jgi:hypothetical protein